MKRSNAFSHIFRRIDMTAHDFANGWQGHLTLPQENLSTRPRTPNFASTTSTRNGIVVFSGGSAANSLVEVFDQLREANHSTLSYVIPISDNGGSSSELIRVFGGPGTRSIYPGRFILDLFTNSN